MTKLPILSTKQVIRVLRAAGFKDAPKKGKGNHVALMKRGADRTRLVIIPSSSLYPKELFWPFWNKRAYPKPNF